MAWVEFHAARIKRLKKFQDFRRALNWSTIEGLGFLGSFWGEVIELAENGDVTGWTPEYVADLTGLKTEPERVWEALANNGWIERRGGRTLLHDWLDTAGRYLESKYRTSNLDKLVEIYRLHGIVYPKSVFSQTKDGPPNMTLPNQPTKPTPAPVAFDWIWTQYPRPEGKKDALRHFLGTVKSQADFEDLQLALRNYKAKLAKDGTEPRYILQGKTWFNNWKDWLAYNGPVAPKAPSVSKPYVPPPIDESDLPSPEEAADFRAMAEAAIKGANKP